MSTFVFKTEYSKGYRTGLRVFISTLSPGFPQEALQMKDEQILKITTQAGQKLLQKMQSAGVPELHLTEAVVKRLPYGGDSYEIVVEYAYRSSLSSAQDEVLLKGKNKFIEVESAPPRKPRPKKPVQRTPEQDATVRNMLGIKPKPDAEASSVESWIKTNCQHLR